MSRWAAKPIISRNRSASGAFSISARRLIISSVIDGSLGRVGVQPDPTGTVDDRREPTRSPACQVRARERLRYRPATPRAGTRPPSTEPTLGSPTARALDDLLDGS